MRNLIKREKENAKNAVSSLTPEEIDNISQNVADKDALYQMLTPAVEEAKDNIPEDLSIHHKDVEASHRN